MLPGFNQQHEVLAPANDKAFAQRCAKKIIMKM